MNLPNYFMADLPREATLTPAMLVEACRSLKRNREHYLANRTTESIIRVLAEVADSWLQPDYTFRKLALSQGPAATGFGHATLVRSLDCFFEMLTTDNLHALIQQDLGHSQRLDEVVATPAEQKAQRSAIARGPKLLAHIGAGNIPNPTLTSIVMGLLVRSAQFVKCASGGSFLPRLFAHSLYEVEPKLASCVEIAEWTGGRQDLEEVLFDEAECLTVTGSDETIAAVRSRVPVRVRLLSYGFRVSFAYVAHEVLSTSSAAKLVSRVADDIVSWNQLGCLSPHVIYVERGGAVTAEYFAELLAAELGRREAIEPRGELTVEEAATITSRRGFYKVRAGASAETRMWCSEASTAWTVIYESDVRFQTSCLNRFVYVKDADDLSDVLKGCDNLRGKVSTVGLAAPELKASELATQLARWGVTRVCPVGHMQKPPLTWRHDGRPALGDLVMWTDWEHHAS